MEFYSQNTWFTSDTHFGHKNIIKYCNRPFANVDEMNEAIIDKWNSKINPTDYVWHLGDFSFDNDNNNRSYFNRLNGHKCLIIGNHDHTSVLNLNWIKKLHYAEIRLDGLNIVLSHYKFQVWNRMNHSSIHLYGHSHAALKANRQSIDVGVDMWNYSPVRIYEICDALANAPEIHPYTEELSN